MSEINLQQVVATNAASFTAASEAWARVAAGLDASMEDYLAAGQYLPHVWPTGQAAQDRFAALQAELGDAYEPCRKISSALLTHANTVLSLQGMLADIQGECAKEGLTVDLVTAKVSPKNPLTDTTQAAQIAGMIQSYDQQLGELLTRARDLDRETAEALARVAPPAPGSANPGSEVTKADLAGLKGMTPAQVRDWWVGLSRDQQDQAIHDFPREVGWLDGVPALDRDKANRFGLAQEKQALQDRLANPDTSYEEREGIQGELDRVETIENGLTQLGPRGLLLGFDTTAYAGEGKLVVAMGNPDTARHTGVWVPGFGTTLSGNTTGNIERIMRMNDRADALTLEAEGDVSTVYWLGYDAPDVYNTSVIHNYRSMDGRDPYADFMQGLRATHETDHGHLVAMGHSYGTTIIGEAAKSHQLPVDDIVVAGSPGMHVDSASELMADPRHVWAGAGPSDPVSNSGVVTAPLEASTTFGKPLREFADGLHGPSPTTPQFGGNSWIADTPGHTHYWDDDTESLMNQSRVLAGTYNQTTLHRGTIPETWR